MKPIVTVSFPLVDDPTVSLLAWTTTPWTLPSNLAVCVHPELTYIKIHDQERDAKFILCDQLLGTLYKDVKKAKYTVLASYKGKEMAGWKYVPLFPYYTERVSLAISLIRLLPGPTPDHFSSTVCREGIQGAHRSLRDV